LQEFDQAFRLYAAEHAHRQPRDDDRQRMLEAGRRL
jgi:hypothetical protein